ncbi:kinase-like protein [Pholiota conissans]|uniref:Kinase-like protein n=1 Tax=Pholiota conissans TaxID=109636 RepID=A0A9P6CZH8_9AGAR|nr:kinase-like protein [Pholiota conissans]
MNSKTTHATAPASFDLTTEEGVRAYLAETPFAGTDIEALSGGMANYVFRIRLSTPHEGKETLVFKHAKPYTKEYHDLKFDLIRQVYEVEALRRVRKWLPEDSIVTVPEVYLFDKDAHAILMEDLGENTVDLKAFMKAGGPSREMAIQIGTALGVFLGKLHHWGKDNAELCDAMKGNEQAKKMTAWAFYGKLISTLTGKDGVPKLQDPPLKVSAKDLEVIQTVADVNVKACHEAEDQFVMGDFWPGNVLVKLDAQGKLARMFVVDWELAKAGLIAVEIGQFCAEIYLLGRCIPEVCQETAPLVLEHFFAEYKREYGASEDVARQTLVRWGTHMVVLGARVNWGEKELSRAVVLEGARIVVDGQTCSSEELKNSLVAGLM